MEFKHQERQTSCGAAAYAMLVGIEESLARKECHTSFSGTSTNNVISALNKRGIDCIRVDINNDYSAVIHDLERVSRNYKCFLASKYVSRYSNKGRDRVRHHAAALFNGFIYDPSENFEVDIFSYSHTFNKQLLIKEIVILLNK